jgi:hypothetical protein
MQIPETQGVHGMEEIFKEIKLRRDSVFRSADKIQETSP